MRAIAATKTTRIQNTETVKKTISDIIKKYCETIPFNFDYASLNWLAYLPQEELRLNLLLLDHSLSEEQKEKIQNNLKDIDQNRSKNQETFSAIISEHLKIKEKISMLKTQKMESEKVIYDDEASDLAASMSASQFEDADKELAAIRKAIPEIEKLKEPSEWQKLMFAEFLKTHSNLSADFLVLRNQFISFLLEKNTVHFPEEYQANAAAKINFPSSNKNTVGLGHLDIKGRKKILAISAPMKSGTVFSTLKAKQDQETLDNFKKTLIDNQIKTVICLGTLAKHRQRLNYRKMLQENNIALVEIDVEDNKSLNLSNNQLRTLISRYKKQDEIDAVHCDSGVGRTGQLRLLFSLLDKFESSDLFSTACNWMLSFFLDSENLDNQEPKVDIKKLVDYLLKKISETLAELRQIRYCVQTEEQFSNTLPQLLLLLIAAQKNYTDEQLNTIREFFDLTLPNDLIMSNSDNLLDDDDNAEEATPFGDDSDIDSLVSHEKHSPSSPTLFQAEKINPPHIPTPPPGDSLNAFKHPR